MMAEPTAPTATLPPNLLSWLRLMRIPNVFTALADILLGYWIVGSPQGLATLAALLLASGSLYLFGMVTNDLFDLAVDARERPQRPLPSGAIRVRSAWGLAAALLISGLAAAALAGWRSLAVAVTLTVLILAYNGKLKQTAIGPAAMGLCRLVNVLLGMSPALGSATLHPAIWLVPLANGVYVTGLTLFARDEAGPDGAGQTPQRLWLGARILFAGLVLHLLILTQARSYAALASALLALCYLWLLALRVLATLAQPTPRRIQSSVKFAILGLIVIDAFAVGAWTDWRATVAILALLPPSLLLGRWVYST